MWIGNALRRSRAVARLISKLSVGVLGTSLFAADAPSLSGLSIVVIAPSSGDSAHVWKSVSAAVGRSITPINTGTSDAQIFANVESKVVALNWALRSKWMIVWAFRGGYGVDRLMPAIVKEDYSDVPKKVLIGYSDITPLLLHMFQKYGWTVIHGPCLREVALGTKSQRSCKALLDFLHGRTDGFVIDDLVPFNKEAAAAKEICGEITGGNLTCIVSTIGTQWQIETKGKIVLLEDTNVKGFYLDRLLTHMANAGCFTGVVAVVLGNFGCDAGVCNVLKCFAERLKIPVYKSSLFGHEKDNMPFGYGFSGSILRVSAKAYKVSMTSKSRLPS
ncbi:MAG: LD-carboxypeptidase [Holosporales bacterium]|jgi:muramoyltetrapeptide carboxypeptidase|nr:LD-carboxypeptidase [Holosporales bacterium]